jgi:hypothetical protein
MAMGVTSPVVDYLVATSFRKAAMDWPVEMGPTGKFLTEFGYKAADLPNGGKIIDV